MDNPGNTKSNDDLQAKLIEQYKNLKKENQELMEKLNKVKVSSTAEINIEKEQHKKVLLELTKVNRENKDLKVRNRQLESTLQIKDNEIQDLKGRLELKGSYETRHQEKDLITFQKYMGRSAMETSAQDSKMVSIIKVFESQKERLEDENRKLSREIDELKDRLADYEKEKHLLKRELGNTHDAVSKEFLSKLENLENENDAIVKENVSLRTSLEKLHIENSRLKQEHFELKRKFDNLKSRMDDEAQMMSSRPLESKELVQTDTNTMSTQQMGGSTMRQEGQENFYSFKPFAQLTDLTLFECRKLISEIQDLFNLRSPSQIVPSIKRMEMVIQAIPRLQGLIQEICELVVPRADGFSNVDQIELIIPSIKDLCARANAPQDFKDLRATIIGLLDLKDGASNNEITRKIQSLIQASVREAEKTGNSEENTLLIEQFSKLLGAKPSLALFKQMLQQFDDIRHFLTLVKKKLGLDPGLSNEACLTHLLKYLENTRREEQAVEIVNRLKKMLVCSAEDIIRRVEEVATQKSRKVYLQ